MGVEKEPQSQGGGTREKKIAIQDESVSNRN